MNLVKKFGAVLGPLVVSLVLFQGCTSSTSSTSSSGSGTGTGWTISITTSKNSASSSALEVVAVIVTVKDSSGAAAPKETQICISASRGGFLSTTDSTVSNTVVAARCSSTTTDDGQVNVFYLPAVMSTDSTGTQTQVAISTGPDTISASSKGIIRSTTIDVIP